MRRAIALAIILSLTALMTVPLVNAATEDSWSTKAAMNQARGGLGVAVVEGKIYAIGGSTASGFAPSIPASAVYGDINLDDFVGTNEEYDPSNDTWTYKAPMPTPRILFATAVYGDKIYCIGGRSISGDTNGGYTSVNEVYDPLTNTWESKAPMPTAAGWLVANVVEGKIYVLDYSGTNYAYNPDTDSWAIKTPVPVGSGDGYASATLDNKIYVTGGFSSEGYSNANMIYEVDNDSWSFGTPPPSSQGGGAAGAATGELSPKGIYVFGEAANLKQGEAQNFTRIYNPETDSWAFGKDPSMDRFGFGVAVLDDQLYVIGGYTYSFPGNFAPLSANEQYTPAGYGTLTMASPSPSVPEFSAWTIPLLLLSIILVAAFTVCKRKTS